MTMTAQPLHIRPGRATRAVTYPAFTRYEGMEVAAGTRPIYLYLRLSKYHRDGADAIERQRLDLTRKIAREGQFTILGEYVDNDSASSSAARTRKGWAALNRDIAEGRVTAVAFWKLDRTSRIGIETLQWLEKCAQQGIELLSEKDSPDALRYVKGVGKLLPAVTAILAEVETDTMSDRQLAAKAHAAEAGFHHGGQAPFGWTVSALREVDAAGRSGKRLVPHPVEFPALECAVQMVLAGHSLTEVANHWADADHEHAHGIVKADGRPVYITSILRSLRSPRLVGYRMRNVPEHKRGIKLDLLDYIARDANGEPVISQQPVCDRETWMRLQRVISDSSTSTTRTPWGSHEWLLTGLVHCATCGGRLYGFHKQDRRANGERVMRQSYVCQTNRRKGAGACAQSSRIDAALAESYVRGWAESYLSADRLAKARQVEAARLTSPESTAALDEAYAERDALLAAKTSPHYRGAMITQWFELMGEVSERIERLERERDAATTHHLPVASGADLADRWDDLSLSERRHILRQAIDRIEVRPGRLPVAERVKVMPAGWLAVGS